MYNKGASFDMESLCHFTIKDFHFLCSHTLLLFTIEVQQEIIFSIYTAAFLTESKWLK